MGLRTQLGLIKFESFNTVRLERRCCRNRNSEQCLLKLSALHRPAKESFFPFGLLTWLFHVDLERLLRARNKNIHITLTFSWLEGLLADVFCAWFSKTTQNVNENISISLILGFPTSTVCAVLPNVRAVLLWNNLGWKNKPLCIHKSVKFVSGNWFSYSI